MFEGERWNTSFTNSKMQDCNASSSLDPKLVEPLKIQSKAAKSQGKDQESQDILVRVGQLDSELEGAPERTTITGRWREMANFACCCFQCEIEIEQ